MRGERGYLKLLKSILENGATKTDRTGIGTKSIFGSQLRFDISDSIPLLTTKRVPFKLVVKELLWFIKGDTNAAHLQEQGVRIWDGNTSREFLDARGLTRYQEGDIGNMYGFQWRHWGAKYKGCSANYTGQGIDQLQNVINEIKTNPDSRRLIVTALNPDAYDTSVLLPCHSMFQFYVNNGALSCQLYMRSMDNFLGAPFNIASYSILTHMIAKICGLKTGEFIHTSGDSHIYLNHVQQVTTQLQREPRNPPRLEILGDQKTIDDFKLEDFVLHDYDPHPGIKASMAI